MRVTTAERGRTRNGSVVVLTASGDGRLFGVVTDAGIEMATSWDESSGENLDGVADWDLGAAD